jgi:hypothetical protein
MWPEHLNTGRQIDQKNYHQSKSSVAPAINLIGTITFANEAIKTCKP